MRKTKKRRNTMCELAVMGILVALLTACSSGETMESTSEPTDDETSVTEVSEDVDLADAEVSEAEVAAKTEAADEAVTEAVGEEEVNGEEETEEEVDEYAQIDMESTLPGVEWIQTFDGVIEDPKLIVFNDSTNKKIILEDFEEVEFYDDDTLAVYIPKGRGEVTRYLLFEEAEYYDNIMTLRKMPSAISRGGYPSPVCIDIEFDDHLMTLYCSLMLMG